MSKIDKEETKEPVISQNADNYSETLQDINLANQISEKDENEDDDYLSVIDESIVEEEDSKFDIEPKSERPFVPDNLSL